jgi:hypothetical protein
VPTFIPLGGDLAGNLVAGLIGNNIVDAFAVADANSQTGKLLRHLIGPAFDEFKSLADMNAVAASATAMNAVAASATAMDAVAASATAMNAICKSAIAAQAVYAPIQSRRSTLLTTLADDSKFSKTTVNVGNGAGTFDHGLNTNTIYIPTACYDDRDTDYTVYYGADTSKSVVSIARHSDTVSVTSGVSLRGVRVVGSSSSVGYVTFDVYTAL